MRLLVSRAATVRSTRAKRKILFIDVREAHLIPKCEEDVYVDLPKEAQCGEDECGKLEFWLYGCRRAGQAWGYHYAEVFLKAGFRRSRLSPVAFYQPERELWCVVHGDDFTFSGWDEDLTWIEDLTKANYEVKVRGRLGTEEGDSKEIDVLGRTIKVEEWGWTWEADKRHRKMVLEHFGFDRTSKSLSGSGDKEDDKDNEEGDQEMTKAEATSFRGVTARTNYCAADCAPIQFATKEVCRDMANPTVKGHEKMKKLARYMLHFEAAVFEYWWHDEKETAVKVFTDSDWAGCRKTRRSTSGGAIQLGGHTLRTWATTQPTVAMSSAEAEYYAMVEGATRGIGLRTMLSEMGVEVNVVVISTDSSSAKSFASQRGLKKMSYIDNIHLFLIIDRYFQ